MIVFIVFERLNITCCVEQNSSLSGSKLTSPLSAYMWLFEISNADEVHFLVTWAGMIGLDIDVKMKLFRNFCHVLLSLHFTFLCLFLIIN